VGILSLVQHLGEVVVPHDLALSALVVVNGLGLELLGESGDLSDVLLKVGEFILSIGDLCIQIADILNDIIDICIQPVIFVLVGDDLVLEDVLLVLELAGVLLEVIDFAFDVVVVEVEFLGVACQQFVVLAHSGCGLVQSESLVEEFFVVG
jgi:hypothetical protein